MSAADTQALWLRLKTAGLVAGEPPLAKASPPPWFVRVILGVAGWIGAGFLLIFVSLGLKFVMESSGASFVAGLITCTAAAMLFRARPDSDFATQFGLALSLAGQVLILVALTRMLNNHASSVALGMALFQAILYFAIPNFIHRVWASCAAAGAIVFALMDWHLQPYAPGLLSAACAWVWLNEFQHEEHGPMLRSGGYGLVLALIGAVVIENLITGLWGAASHPPPINEYHQWPGAALGGIALLWAVYRLLVREQVNPASGASWRILAASSILAVATLKAPGLAPAALILLLGFGCGNRVLFGLGVAALLGYLSAYYYSMDVTLLHKSALMAVTGVALLAVRLILVKQWPASPHQENRHA